MSHTAKENVESCGICHQPANAVRDKTVTCSGSPGCGRCFHTVCADLNLTMWAALASDDGLKWFCAECRSDKSPEQKSAEVTLKDIMARIDRLEAKVDSGFAKCHDQLRVKMGRQSDVAGRIESPRPAVEPRLPKHCSTITPPSTAKNEKRSRKKTTTLPDDLWKKVFQNLSVHQLFQVRLTCRLWNRIVGTSSVMDRMEICFPEDVTLSSDSGEVGALKSTHYKRMVLDYVTIIDPNIWWPKVCANLHTLTVNHCKVPLDELLQMLEQATKLKELTVGIYNPSVLPNVNFQLKSLETLVLCGYAHLETLELFKNVCTRLNTLTLPLFNSYNKINNNDKLYESALEFIMSLKKTLQNLTVRGGSDDFCRKIILSTNNTIALKHLTCELQNNSLGEQYNLKQPCIESLHLTCGYDIAMLKTLGKKHPLLKELEFNTRSIYSIIYTSEFFEDLQELQYLKVNAFGNYGKAEFMYSKQVLCSLVSLDFRRHTLHNNWLKTFPNLKILKLESCEIDSWNEFFMQCSNLTHLRHLELSHVSSRKICNNSCVLKINRSLRVLKLAGCSMSKHSIISVFGECSKLEEISLKDMESVDDTVIIKLVKQSGRCLKKITIISRTMTEASVQTIIKFCDKIEKITIEIRGEIADTVVQQLKCHRNARVKFGYYDLYDYYD